MNTYDDLSVYWLRQDLRLTDNPALTKSLESNNVLVIYILDDNSRDNKWEDQVGGGYTDP